jgi:protein-S-isoprenylcysteine O-methyltransferase Ste14
MNLRIPPLLAGAAAWLLMWLVAQALPALGRAWPWQRPTAFALMAIGAGIGIAGVLEFRRARTTVNPLRPDTASTLVAGGIYRHTRNPMYVGVAIATLGWAVLLGHALAPLGVVAFVLWMDRQQIPAEERALHALFGAQFERYCNEVRRWL